MAQLSNSKRSPIWRKYIDAIEDSRKPYETMWKIANLEIFDDDKSRHFTCTKNT